MSVQWWPRLNWFSSDSPDRSQKLVSERDTLLSANTVEIGKVRQESQGLLAVYKMQKAAYPAFFESLSQPLPTARSDKEMFQELGELLGALMMNLSNLDSELDKLCPKAEVLEKLITSWERIEAHYDQILADLEHIHQMDEKNLEELARILDQVMKLGVQPLCRAGPDSQ